MAPGQIVDPTAVQAVSVEHVTSDSEPDAPLGFGTAWPAQVAPFHRSAAIDAKLSVPTASHATG
jgi:hypothetical protein